MATTGVPAGSPVVVVSSGGVPVVNDQKGPPMTVGGNGKGVPVTIVSDRGTPVTLLKEDGTAYP